MILSDPCGVALSLMTPSPPSSTRFIYAYSITSSVVKRFVHHHCDSQSRFILETQEKTTAAHRHSQGDKAAACGNKLRQVSTARPGPPAEERLDSSSHLRRARIRTHGRGHGFRRACPCPFRCQRQAVPAVQGELRPLGQHAPLLQVPPFLLRLPPTRRPEEVPLLPYPTLHPAYLIHLVSSTGTTSSATATLRTPPSSTTAAAPRTPTLPDAPQTCTVPTTTPRTSKQPSLPLPLPHPPQASS